MLVHFDLADHSGKFWVDPHRVIAVIEESRHDHEQKSKRDAAAIMTDGGERFVVWDDYKGKRFVGNRISVLQTPKEEENAEVS